jgi:hypothetical protein
MMMMIQHLLVAILALLLHPGCSFAPHRVVIAITKGAIEILLAFSLLASFSPSNNKSEMKLITTMGYKYGRGLKYTTNMNPILILRLQIRRREDNSNRNWILEKAYE